MTTIEAVTEPRGGEATEAPPGGRLGTVTPVPPDTLEGRPPPGNGANGKGGNGGFGDGDFGGREGLPVPAGKIGLLLALGSMSIIFSALASAYIVRMGLGGWVSIPLMDMPLLWVNTGILGATSVALVVAWKRSKSGGELAARAPVLFALALGVAFLVGQWFAWGELQQAGLYVATTPASSFFYLITAFHGLHIFGGLVALGWVVRRLGTSTSPGSGVLAVELTGLYWHFLLVVWLGLFGLMLVT